MLKRLMPIPLRFLSAFCLLVLAATSTFGQQENVSFDRMKKDLFFLAGPECEGRDSGSKGIDVAAEYIIDQISKIGLKPAGKDGGWFQPFTIAGKGGVKGASSVSLKGPQGQTIDLQAEKDFAVLPSLGSGKIEGAFVFAGYGVTVPAGAGKAADGKKKEMFEISFQKKGGKGGGGDPQKKGDNPPVTSEGYDDFKGIDAKGKVVIVLRRVPRWDNDVEQFGGDKTLYQGVEKKIAACEQAGAAAVIIVNDQSEIKNGDPFMTAAAPKAAIPVIQVKRDVLDKLLVSGKGTTLAELEKDIDIDLKPRSGPIAGWSGTLATTTKQASILCKNVVGVLEGSGPLANETIVVSAHYDHLGTKAGKDGAKAVYYGADDNGSGSTTIIELARRFAAIKNREGRRMVFIWFSAEERGLLGSKAYCKDPIFPLKDTIACMNMDMIGRLKDEANPKLYAEGFNTGKGMPEMLERLNKEAGFVIAGPHPQGVFGRSDQASFYAKGIPGMFFFTDFHSDYHKTGDTPDKINIKGMIRIAGLMEKILLELSTQKERPEYVAGAIKAGAGLPGGKGKGKAGAKLSLVPDYNDKADKGTLVESVTAGGAAEKAGIKAGDRIVSLAGKPTTNPTIYTQVLTTLVPGTAIEAVIMRGDKELKLKVTPD